MKKPEDKPFGVRLGELKRPMQIEAVEQDRSLHYLIKKILKEYVKKKVAWIFNKDIRVSLFVRK
mgnify:CR=1 FL=1